MKRLFYFLFLFLALSAAMEAQSFNIWQSQGQLVGLTGKSNPNVIYEGNAQILSGNVFKMWCTPNNFAATGVYYYESLDGITGWTAHPSNPIVNAAGMGFPTLYKVGSTYYLYTGNSTEIDVRTSSDGITFSAPTTNVITLGAAGQWDDSKVYQLNLIPGTPGFGTNTGETYYAYYEGIHTSSGEGLATTTNLAGAWTKSGSNPILVGFAPMTFQQIGGTYYLWAPDGGVSAAIGALGSNGLVRLSATNPAGPWTWLTFGGVGNLNRVLVMYPTIAADLSWSATQLANLSDPYIVSALGNMYMYWSKTTLSGVQGGINMAVATGVTPAQQVSGYEGMKGFPIPGQAQQALNLNTLGTDSFLRPDANPIGGHWTPIGTSGFFIPSQIVSHLVESTAINSDGASYWNAASFPNDQWSQVTVQTNNASYIGPNARMNTSGAATMYRTYWHNATTLGAVGTMTITSVILGIATTLSSFTNITVNSGDNLMLVVSGSNLLIYYNYYPLLAATDPNITSGAAGFTIQDVTALANAQISGFSGGGFKVAPSLAGSGQIGGLIVGP